MARNFDGSTEFLRAAAAAVTSPPFTMCCWARPTLAIPTGVPGYLVWVGDASASNHMWRIGFSSGGQARVNARQGGTSETTQSSTIYTQNEWHHVAAVITSATERSIFLDGGGKGTGVVSIAPTGVDRTSIGRTDDSTPTEHFTGDIGHVAIWNVALTDQEIASLAADVSPFYMRRDDLIAYWPLNGQSPEPDVVGGLDMTLFGTPAAVEEPPIPHSIVAP